MTRSVVEMLCVWVVMGFIATNTVLGDDLFPPPWRGQPGSTWAEWEFSTPVPNPPPDMGYNPYGEPTMQIFPGVGQVWWPELNGRQGVWPLSGEIWVDIPNRPEPYPWKDIYIQLTWEPQAPGNIPYVMTTLPAVVPGALVQTIPLGGLWQHSIYTIRLEPNPPWEQILITGGIDVDQVVIDTICYPEPSALGLLGIGALMIVRRRRA